MGGDGLWNVHVHVDDVGAAIEAGIAAGRLHRVRVTHFAEQLAELRHRPPPAPADASSPSPPGPGWPACSRSRPPSYRVVPGGGPPPGQLLEAITVSGAAG